MVGASAAFSSGYPVAAVITPASADDPVIIVVGKFDQGAFDEAQADQLSDAVVSLMESFGLSQGDTELFKLSVLRTQCGLTDADLVKGFVKGIYRGAWYDLYLFLEMSKRPRSLLSTATTSRLMSGSPTLLCRAFQRITSMPRPLRPLRCSPAF